MANTTGLNFQLRSAVAAHADDCLENTRTTGPDSSAPPEERDGFLPGMAARSRALCALEEIVVDLFDQLRMPLLRYLTTFGFGLADREEIVQEVFLSLFQHLRKDRSRVNLRAWLFQVAHNLALKRRQKNRRALVSSTAPAVDPALSAEDQMIRDQAHRQVRAVINALPEQDKRCLSLRAEGLRYREVAEVLGMSLGSVSISLTRSLARIARSSNR